MSRHNKVNRDSYTQAGRLTPDDMARERHKQARPHHSPARAAIKNLAGGAVRRRRGARASTAPESDREEQA
jgi:hypothetical protein